MPHSLGVTFYAALIKSDIRRLRCGQNMQLSLHACMHAGGHT